MINRSQLRSILLLGTVACAAVVVTSAARISAQQRTLPYDLLQSREQLQALRQAWNEKLPYVPGEVLVKFRDGVEAAGRVRALSATRGGIEERNVRWIGDVLWVRADGEPDAVQLAAVLGRQPEVAWAQPNYFRRTSARPNDPEYAELQWNFDLIEMPRAWDVNQGSNDSMIVAIVDSGVTTVTQSFPFPLWTGQRIETVSVPFRVSPDLSTSRILPGRDFIFWTGPVLDMDGHGTHVAGTALEETNNNQSLAGIAYRAKLLPVKVCVGYWEIQIATSAAGIPGFVDPEEENGGCSDAAIAQGIRYAADNGAQVINMSLGGPGQSPALREALTYAVGRGSFVSISIGNEFEDGNPVEYPAAYAEQIEGVMSVGAVGRNSTRAFYSNTGSHLEIMAPGGNPRDGGDTGFVWQMMMFPPDFDPFDVIRPRFDRYTEVGSVGTSMASPHVAGVAALLHTQGINQPGAIEAAIKRFATDLGAAGRDNDYGFGLVNARNTLRGFGAAR
jgi:serine protease